MEVFFFFYISASKQSLLPMTHIYKIKIIVITLKCECKTIAWRLEKIAKSFCAGGRSVHNYNAVNHARPFGTDAGRVIAHTNVTSLKHATGGLFP